MQANSPNNSKKVVILGTGGTIAGHSGSSGDNVGYKAGQVSVQSLASHLSAGLAEDVITEQVAQLDSKDMVFPVWASLAERVDYWASQSDVLGILITHGTDTVEETAYFLHATINTIKPVVIVCAMRPASSLNADGPQNLRDGLAVVRQSGATGVTVVCAGKVHDALAVRKVYPYQLDAFSSGEAGPLAFVEEGRVRLQRAWLAPQQLRPTPRRFPAAWPWVEVVWNMAGADGRLLKALLAASSDLHQQGQPGLQGIVVAATGNGSIHEALEQVLVEAQQQGVRVVVTSRCPLGQLVPGQGAPTFDWRPGLSPYQARIDLMLDLIVGSSGGRATPSVG
jgi:L-asparaginase